MISFIPLYKFSRPFKITDIVLNRSHNIDFYFTCGDSSDAIFIAEGIEVAQIAAIMKA